jgi:tetratricopeptide (TPR) repeat protein
MRWLQLEYIAKGLFLGLLLFIALAQPAKEELQILLLAMLGGLVAGLAVAGFRVARQGYRIQGRVTAFLLFLVLENPALTYVGILAGTALATFLAQKPTTESWLLPVTVAGGVILGIGFPLVGLFKNRWVRFGVGLALALAPVAAVLVGVWLVPTFVEKRVEAGIFLLIGIPFFYLLTLAGRAEETEVEIGAICGLMCLGFALWQPFPTVGAIAFAVPAAIYYAYTTRYLPKLRVFKHAMRGLSYASVGRHRQALRTFRRALELDPRNRLAKEGLWNVHRSLDLVEAARDPELVALVDPEMCLQRAGSLLIEAKPTAEQLQEANHLIDFVLNQRPAQRPTVLYWRAVAHLKVGEVDRAAEELTSILDPAGYPAGDPQREKILLQAWQLALQLHPEMQRRVGAPQLAIAGRKMEAIGVVERRLAENVSNSTALELKRLLYASLTEEEYNQKAADKAAADFDHTYVQQLGLALLGDTGRWQRGAEFLRIAARGLPAQGPSIFVQVAQAANKAGATAECWKYYRMAREAGRAVGPKNLAEEEKQAFFATVKLLADNATHKGDLDEAIDAYQLFSESERSGVETLRTLAGLYEKKGDQPSILNAIRMTEQGLLYDGSEKDLLERKDRYYYSVMPETVKERRENIAKWFDSAYCLKKARSILDNKNSDLDMIDWALHLAQVAGAVQPASTSAKVFEARARLRKGERDAALVILEDLREAEPKEFPGEDDQEMWFLGNRILGDLYLNELARPDLAILCYTEFRKSTKSGADTLYKLGQAHEACGDLKKAAKYYEQVTAYESHPLVYDARQALYRVQSESESKAPE